METNNIELLEAYMEGTLTPEQQLQVESRLKTDAAFKQDYDIYQLMLAAITENRKTELKTFISKNVRVKPAPFFKAPTFYAAAAASVVLCLISYFVIYKKLNEQNAMSQNENKDSKIENVSPQSHDSVSPVANNNSSKSKTADSSITGNSKKEEKEKGIVAFGGKDELKKEGEANNADNGIDNISSKPEEIKVEGDKMESDTFLFISRKIYIPKPKQYQTGPDDLYTVITTGDNLKIEVQFWTSPINYTGYKFSKNLLVIYGNFDPELATFQELKDIVYMKYKSDYYKISSNETYSGMKKETDAKIIADLERK